MKKLFKILPLMLLLVSCGTRQTSAPVHTPPPTESIPEVSTPKKMEAVTMSQKSAGGDLTEIKSCEYDFDLDGKSDFVRLFVDADVSESGEIYWDDFHEWVLEVQMSSGGFYTLFDGAVSLGQLYFEVCDVYNTDVVPVITTYLTTSSSLDIKQFAFVKEEFQVTQIYSSEDVSTSGINRIYSSIPTYGSYED